MALCAAMNVAVGATGMMAIAAGVTVAVNTAV